ncbi:hypothetical protein [Nitrospina gracilis]|uniref:hypothetical protein n=1 Tax=Nitrospina gracilis TaxID=35801 RepID=UPI001F2F86D1|nr:hypothetical protein [Nitrospina gracilis]MCF8720620.1 hypothetical protein [Nitrospina gracilis Nb-211]
MIREKLNKLIEDISQSHSMDDIYQAKKDYQAVSGEIFEDDKSYEARMGLFLEWFAFDRPINGSETPLDQFLQNHSESVSEEDRELCEGLKQSRHSLFLMKKSGSGQVVVNDLFEDEKLVVKEDEGKLFFNKDDVFEARLLPFRKQYFFTENFCHHPRATYKYILSKVKPIIAEERQDHKSLKKMNKDWASLKKEIDGLARDIEKLSLKRDGTDSEKKKEKLSQKLEALNAEKLQLEIRFYELQNRMEDLETNKIRIGHRARRFSLMKQLAYMSLKWERYHNVDVRDIYRD